MKTILGILFSALLYTTSFAEIPLVKITIDNRMDIRDTSIVVDLQSEVDLHISNIMINTVDLRKLSQRPWIEQVTHLTFSDFICNKHAYPKLVEMLGNGKIRKFSMIDSELKDIPELSLGDFFAGLESIDIRRSKFPDHFYQQLTAQTTPNLAEMVFRDNNLNNDFVDHLVENGLLTQLAVLDLSINNLGSHLLANIPANKPGKLRSLKLNYTNLQRSTTFPDWTAPFFENVRELELINVVKGGQHFLYFCDAQVIQELDIYLGIIPEFPPEAPLLDINHLRAVFKYPLKSRRNIYRMSTVGLLSDFLASSQSQFAENLILVGPNWMDVTLAHVLENLNMPALKHIQLIDVAASQESLYQLVRDYPQYSFEIVFANRLRRGSKWGKKNAGIYDAKYWPSAIKKPELVN